MVFLDELAQFLDQYFAVQQFGDEQGGIYHNSLRPIRRIGLALEPWTEIAQWITEQQLDAIFLHRPWKLELEQPELKDIGIISYHLAFDERLTLGFNPRLSQVLGMSEIEILGKKQGRPIGVIAEILPQSFANFCSQIDEIFGGKEQVYPGNCQQVSRVAVVGAMTEVLVHEAAVRGANIYLTGQWRQPAQAAVLKTKINVITVGHRRCEAWGLRALAGVMRERWSKLEVICANSEA
ncbi:MAG: Nif3-like dinuclear metal center hexameric protein [Coleofasciculaceae cyanobacterium]